MWERIKKWTAMTVFAIVALWIAIVALLPLALAVFLANRWIPDLRTPDEEVDRILDLIEKEIKGR